MSDCKNVNFCKLLSRLRLHRTPPSVVVLAVYTADLQLESLTTTLLRVDSCLFPNITPNSYLSFTSSAFAWAPCVLLCFLLLERPLLAFLDLLRPLLRVLLSSQSANILLK
jgi:hypothetical protein